MKIFVAAGLVAAALTIAGAASAAGSIPVRLPAPPPPGSPVASTLRDALTAIEQLQATNPAAAQSAAFSYNAAIEQYNAHDYERARMSALTAIRQSAVPPAPADYAAHRPLVPAAFPGPSYFIIPDELPATPANAQRYVTLAHHRLASCASAKATADYRGAVAALGAKAYRAAMADARNTVDDCTAAR